MALTAAVPLRCAWPDDVDALDATVLDADEVGSGLWRAAGHHRQDGWARRVEPA